MDDLELQLGSTSVEYLRARLTYRHSAFPQHDDGDAAARTRLETTVTAALKRLNTASPWAPPAPAPPVADPLLAVVVAGWGPPAAADVARRMAMTAEHAAAPPPSRAPPAPRKIWSELRRVSSSARGTAARLPTRVQRVPSSSTFPTSPAGCGIPRPSRNGAATPGVRRQEAGAARGRHSLGHGALRGGTGTVDGADSASERRSPGRGSARSGGSKGDSAKWSWTGWWQ